jgi:hypothetical protein
VAGKPFEVELEGLRVALGIGHGFARACFDQNSASVMPVHPQSLNSAKWQRPSILRWRSIFGRFERRPSSRSWSSQAGCTRCNSANRQRPKLKVLSPRRRTDVLPSASGMEPLFLVRQACKRLYCVHFAATWLDGEPPFGGLKRALNEVAWMGARGRPRKLPHSRIKAGRPVQ